MIRTFILIGLFFGVLTSCKEKSSTNNPPASKDAGGLRPQPQINNPTTDRGNRGGDLDNSSPLLQLQQYAENGDSQTLAYADSLLSNPDLAAYNSDILTMKVIYFGKQKKYKEAEALCDLIIKNDYTYLQAYLEKGWLLFEQNKPNEALKVFELATTVKNNFAEAYFWKGRSYQKLKQPDTAILEFKKALALDPGLEEARTELKSMGAIQ